MKSLRRISVLLVAILVIGSIPGAIGGQASRNAYFHIPTPTLDTAPVPDFHNGIPTLVSQPSPVTVLSEESPIALAQATAPAVALAEATLTEQRPTRTAVPLPSPTRTAIPSPSPTMVATPAPSADAAHATPAADALALFIHLPPQAAQRQPLRVLLVLHGMGGNGAKFAENYIADADRNGWVLIAPTMPYTHDYKDPNQLREEDLALGHTLHTLIESMPKRLGLSLRQHVMIIGFSRGAQLAHRFALFHPDLVESLALISAGSYTMPWVSQATSGGSQGIAGVVSASRTASQATPGPTSSASKMLAFPLGVGDLPKYLGSPIDWQSFRKISFWIGVGEKDNRTADVARAFDSYGDTRVQRARTYCSALLGMGVDAQLVVFPNVDHEVTADMRAKALEFLRKDELADNWND